METAALKDEVATANGETASLDFKSTFDPTVLRDWVETIKDVVAMHNSGGGIIVFGLECDGTDSGPESGIKGVVDPTHVGDKFQKYTGRVLQGLIVERFEKCGKMYDGWIIPGAIVPVPFKDPGTWEKPDKRQETVFSKGQLYFRQGAKSAPACYDDMLALCQHVAETARVKFASEMQNVARMPDNYIIQAVHPDSIISVPRGTGQVRVTDDPTAPGCVVVDKFKTHKYARKEATARLLTRLPETKLTVFHVQCIRRVHGPELRRLDLIYEPKEAGPRYSEGFVEWVVENVSKNSKFLSDTRAEYDKIWEARKSAATTANRQTLRGQRRLR